MSTKTKYDLHVQKEKYDIVGNKFSDGYAIAIREMIDFDTLKEQYPNAEMPKDIIDDSIALDWRFIPNEETGEIEQGVQITIRTIAGKGVAEVERFESQSIQYIMDMEKFEDLFGAMKKLKKKAKPDIEAYNRHRKQELEDQKAHQERMAAYVGNKMNTEEVRKEVANRIVDTIMSGEIIPFKNVEENNE